MVGDAPGESVEGERADRRVGVLREGVECPSPHFRVGVPAQVEQPGVELW